MSKKSILVLSIAVLLVLIPFAYVQLNKMNYAQRVTQYLIDTEKYRKEEIKSVRGVWGVKLPSFYSVVIFKDEPEVEYIYFAHDGVMQFSYRIAPEGTAEGITESELKHYVPLE
ncbi:DUF3139 domain-containing protein [Paenibacillus albidus]|uniref:DUF3139 domain-containing protein n=1 Tax=Paenibacillus albidus TaxID=2041023 RepID=UPI001BE9E7D3|nr:DUF3139 domain-containing protein [Paenibacillus albidus]MBT2291721.1 DUF3139 domain-containing protein [Paenibacillus albidus]